MRFEIELGLSSECGRRERNEDFAGVQAPASHERERGYVAALADGVGGGGDGLIAAQTSVMSLLRDFHATPAHWDASVALERLLQHQNAWLLAHNRRPAPDGQPREALCTLTAIALVGRRYAIAHVGDSRAWLLRDGRCLQLTQDHRREGRDFAGLTRAMGLDEALHLDHSQGELRVGDRLLLSSDGLHGALREREIATLLREAPNAQAAADRLTAAALQAGSSDNVSALVITIKDLAGADLADLVGSPLPCPGLLGVGAQLDGFTITAVVADNGVRRLLQARDGAGGLVAIKLLHPSRTQDAEERAMLAHEIWLGQRLAGQKRRGLSSNPLVRLRQPESPSAFYAVFDWHGGQTLEQLIAAAPLEPAQAVDMAKACAQALGLLHAARCVHRDVKPANLHRGDDGVWRLLDLGVTLSPRAPKSLAGLHAGTPAYVNPEQWDGEAPTPGSDLYALGVTLYQALTGRLPFGELAPYQDSRKRKEPPSVTRLNPAVPMWLDRLVARAMARDAGRRFETAEELLLELERGAARGLQTVAPRAQRDPLLPWQLGLAVSLLFNALLVLWLLALPTG
jgi:serine/threonine protein phosphatase PrpC